MDVEVLAYVLVGVCVLACMLAVTSLLGLPMGAVSIADVSETGDGVLSHSSEGQTDTQIIKQSSSGKRVNASVASEYGVEDYEWRVSNASAVQRVTESSPQFHAELPFNTSISNTGTDTSGDGFSDSFTAAHSFMRVDAVDVFIEVNTVSSDPETGARLYHFARVADEYSHAPTTRPIRLHFIFVSEPVGYTTDVDVNATTVRNQTSAVTTRTYLRDRALTDSIHRTQGNGTYHLGIVDQPVFNNTAVKGFYVESHRGREGVVVQSLSSGQFGKAVSHELGHLFGISGSRPGVDSKHRSYLEYPSVMNYNSICAEQGTEEGIAQPACYEYTANDWTDIEQELTDPDTTPEMGNLD